MFVKKKNSGKDVKNLGLEIGGSKLNNR